MRLHPKVVVRVPSPNRSARTTGISLVVIHDSESFEKLRSLSDLKAIGELFSNPNFDASAHVCTDADGHSARYVPDREKAWHVVSYNSAALGIEQIGFASQKQWTDAEVNETARWVARWSLKYGIPIRRAWVARGRVIRSGVITHKQLGSAGGGHSDPGPSYPMRRMKAKARGFKRALKSR